MSAPRAAWIAALVLVVVAVLGRLAPHPWNMTPVGAAALFAGATLPRPFAIAVPVVALAVSDLVIGVHSLWWATWGACALAVLLGELLRTRRTVLRVGAVTIAGSLLFFVVTNFAVWMQGTMYPLTPAGLAACFAAAIPFFQHSLLGDLLWSGVLFGAWELVTRARHWPRVLAQPHTPNQA